MAEPTLYRLAVTDGDYMAAKAMCLSEGFEDVDLQFPTVMAIQGEDVIGVLGTRLTPDMILAGPLAIRQDRPRHFTLMRLGELYDAAMRKLGISSYIFSTRDAKFAATMEKMHEFKPYAVKDGEAYYLRKL